MIVFNPPNLSTQLHATHILTNPPDLRAAPTYSSDLSHLLTEHADNRRSLHGSHRDVWCPSLNTVDTVTSRKTQPLSNDEKEGAIQPAVVSALPILCLHWERPYRSDAQNNEIIINSHLLKLQIVEAVVIGSPLEMVLGCGITTLFQQQSRPKHVTVRIV